LQHPPRVSVAPAQPLVVIPPWSSDTMRLLSLTSLLVPLRLAQTVPLKSTFSSR